MVLAERIAERLGPRYRTGDPDIEKQCTRCLRVYGPEESWWPADQEFFSPDNHNGPGRLHSWCHACVREAKAEKAARGASI